MLLLNEKHSTVVNYSIWRGKIPEDEIMMIQPLHLAWRKCQYPIPK